VNLTDRLEQISATIRELRASAADGPKSRLLIDSLFRTVHSFKAASSAAGRDDLSRAAHEFENLLHSLRTGKLSLDDEVLQALDETAIALHDGSKTSSLDRLQQTEKLDSNALPPEFAILKDDERHRAAAATREGANLYVMKVVFEAGDFDERFRQLKEQLEKNAELISTSASMEDARISFQVFYASRSEKIPVQTVLQQTVLAGKAAADKLAKQIKFVIKDEEFLLDKQSADVLTDALIHLVRNAVDHGIESHGTVIIEAAPGQFVVTDDGRGIAIENLPLIFQPGFSTTKDVTEFSGRGVGLDAVRIPVEELGGSVSVTSEPGKGSSFIIKIPHPSSGA
jgi:two-component system, chemotaxis family, sensor kinase CheA